MKRFKNKKFFALIALLSSLVLILFLSLITRRAGAAGGEVFDIGSSAYPQAAGTNSTVYIPLMIGDHPLETIFGYEYSSIGTSHGLTEMHQAGANWVREQGIWWANIESTKGIYDWAQMSSVEAEFLNAQSKNMNVIAMVRGTPSWAQADPPYNRECGRIKPTEFASFAAFVSELVTRYSYAPYNVKYWELYNEPDVDPSLVAPGNDWMGCWGNGLDEEEPNYEPYYGGGYYADMLKVVYPAVKLANPDAQVLIGSLLLNSNPVTTPPSCDPTPGKFLEGIIQNGGGPFFDGVGFHAYETNHSWLGGYSWRCWGNEANTTGPSVGLKAQYIRDLLSDNGVTGKYLMNTEAALQCLWGDPAVCEMTKAYYIIHIYVVALKADLKANLWYFWYEKNGELLEPDNTPLPAYYTYQFAREKLKFAVYNQEIALTSGVRTYELNVPSGRIWVVWSLDGADHHGVVLPGTPMAVYDSDGDSITPAGTINIGLEPMYLEWNP